MPIDHLPIAKSIAKIEKLCYQQSNPESQQTKTFDPQQKTVTWLPTKVIAHQTQKSSKRQTAWVFGA